MSRPTPNKRTVKVRTSKRHCEEKLCCQVFDAKAEYYCRQCKSSQCLQCEKTIHSIGSSKDDLHSRVPLEKIPTDTLCEGAGNNVICENVNFADIWCENCKQRYCYNCYDKAHIQSKKKLHHHLSFKEYENRKNRKEQQTVQHNLKPLSPVSFNDDSLTYLSCPQAIPPDSVLCPELVTSEDENMSFTSFHSDHSQGSIPDICQGITEPLDYIIDDIAKELDDVNRYQDCHGFILATEKEELKVKDAEDFCEKLGCSNEGNTDIKVKVVSIFGNTGDGKSHTLNHTFFGGKEVFQTSAGHASCTVGIWAAYDPNNKAIIIDTEGLLGVADNSNQRTRLLLKVLAISDVVIYRTRAERLHSDMFRFISDASKSYLEHFTEALKKAAKKHKHDVSISNLGPAIVIFHETIHTDVLACGPGKTPESEVRAKFKNLKCTIDAFSGLSYVGTKTQNPPTDFHRLQKVTKELLGNNNIRAARDPRIVFNALKALNDTFCGDIDKPGPNTFPDQYFTCSTQCLACGAKCMRSMSHTADDTNHQPDRDVHCRYQHQFGNMRYLCKKCIIKGNKNFVVPKTSASSDNTWVGLGKYLWSGYVLECPNCGIIYRSRQYWYGNHDIETIVHMEVMHIWPDSPQVLDGTHNAARKFLDGLHIVASTIGTVGAKPTKMIAEWTADQIAPAYWVPNSQILVCHDCQIDFTHNEQKHHCRACGQGFCDECSSKSRAVPERGWGVSPVRVCNKCYQGEGEGGETPVTARKVGEVVSSTFGAVASAIDLPFGMLKDSARPAYWVPDEQITECILCKIKFSYKVAKHHCRACGQGVCDECSSNKLPVPLRGWDYPVRVCTKCEKRKDYL